jgi:DNA invertase Pin-like site-specific DNA recombinase
MAKNYAYIRVSTSAQDLEKQKYGILEYCNEKNIRIHQFFEDVKSGKATAEERTLQTLLDQLESGDRLIIPEISRLGRKVHDVLQTLSVCETKGVTVIAIKENLICGKTDNLFNANLVFTTIYALFAEIERSLNRARTKEALDAKKARGEPLGKPKGTKQKLKLDARGPEIRKYYVEYGLDAVGVARIMGISLSSLKYWIKSRLSEKEIKIRNQTRAKKPTVKA